MKQDVSKKREHKDSGMYTFIDIEKIHENITMKGNLNENQDLV